MEEVTKLAESFRATIAATKLQHRSPDAGHVELFEAAVKREVERYNAKISSLRVTNPELERLLAGVEKEVADHARSQVNAAKKAGKVQF